MNGLIRVTPSELITASDEFNGKGCEIGTITSNMMSLVVNLSSVWQSDASAAYIARFRGLEDDIQRMLRMIAEHVEDLQEMARLYNCAEEQNLSDVESLCCDVIV